MKSLLNLLQYCFCFSILVMRHMGSSTDGSVIKNPLAGAGNEGDAGSVPGSGRSPGEGHGNPLQYPCLENPMDRGAWWATVHGVTKS